MSEMGYFMISASSQSVYYFQPAIEVKWFFQ